GPDRVAKGPVVIYQVLLGNDQRLGLGGQVAVVPGVVQRRGHDGEAASEGGRRTVRLGFHAGDSDGVAGDARRGARLVFYPAAGAMCDEQLVVELRLRRPRFPRLTRLEEDGDLVLVAILVAGLDADNERHRLTVVGCRGGHVWRRVAGFV